MLWYRVAGLVNHSWSICPVDGGRTWSIKFTMGLKSRNVCWNPIALIGKTQRWGACASSAPPSSMGKKRKRKSIQKKETSRNHAWGSSSHPEPSFTLFSHRFYCCPGHSLKLWISCKCFLKSSAQTEQAGEHISALRFNVFWMPGPSPIPLQAPSTSRQEWNHLPSSSSLPCACYGLVKVFLSPLGPSLRKGGSWCSHQYFSKSTTVTRNWVKGNNWVVIIL